MIFLVFQGNSVALEPYNNYNIFKYKSDSVGWMYFQYTTETDFSIIITSFQMEIYVKKFTDPSVTSYDISNTDFSYLTR